MSKDVPDLWFKDKNVVSLAWWLLAAVLLAHAQPGSTSVLRPFDRVLMLEEKAETSAGVSVGDVNGDGLPQIVLGKGRHWPLFNRVLLNDVRRCDGGGHLDIVVRNNAPDRKIVYLNDGKSNFTEFRTFGDPKWSTGFVTLEHLNSDGIQTSRLPSAATIPTWWTENPVMAAWFIGVHQRPSPASAVFH